MAHFRSHWKKYTFGSVALGLLGRWAWKRNEEFHMMRRYCLQVNKEYGEQTCEMNTRFKKVYVFLNPHSNNKGARKKFERFSAPLFHLSGMDVIIVESDYEGQIQTLLGYIDPSTEAVVVAGGGGTLMEVVNGLLRRSDSEDINIPVGVVPLGKENQFFRQLYQTQSSKLPLKSICEATIDIIKGHTVPVNVMKLVVSLLSRPEKGKVVYSMSGVDWGAIYNAEKNKDSFKLLGRLRTACSYMNTAFRKWPDDFKLDLWHNDVPRPLDTPASNDYSSHSPLGFKLRVNQSLDNLSLSLWPLVNEDKKAFIRQGWQRTLDPSLSPYMSSSHIPSTLFTSKDLTLSPKSTQQQWYGIDGEPFEAVSFRCTVLPNRIQVFRSNNLTTPTSTS